MDGRFILRASSMMRMGWAQWSRGRYRPLSSVKRRSLRSQPVRLDGQSASRRVRQRCRRCSTRYFDEGRRTATIAGKSEERKYLVHPNTQCCKLVARVRIGEQKNRKVISQAIIESAQKIKHVRGAVLQQLWLRGPDKQRQIINTKTLSGIFLNLA